MAVSVRRASAPRPNAAGRPSPAGEAVPSSWRRLRKTGSRGCALLNSRVRGPSLTRPVHLSLAPRSGERARERGRATRHARPGQHPTEREHRVNIALDTTLRQSCSPERRYRGNAAYGARRPTRRPRTARRGSGAGAQAKTRQRSRQAPSRRPRKSVLPKEEHVHWRSPCMPAVLRRSTRPPSLAVDAALQKDIEELRGLLSHKIPTET